MKSFAILPLLLLLSFSVSTLVKTKVANGITISLPPELIPMTPDDIAQRFPSVRAPLAAFTNIDRLVDFSVNISATMWPDKNVPMAQKFFKASLQNLYDRVDFIGEGTTVLRKNKFIFFEFESRISGDRRKQELRQPVLKYTYIQYLVQNDRTLVFSFSCPKDLMEEWQPVAREMMKSLRVR